MRRLLILLAALAVCATAEYTSKSKDKLAAPAWPATYSVRGTLKLPYAEVNEPFFGWYDGPGMRSRIDYYGGMVKTYQLAHRGSHGSSLKIAPITTEDAWNTQTCLEANGTKEFDVTAQSVLPDLTEFKCIGEEMIAGIRAEKWQLITKIEQKVNKYTLWMHYKNDENKVKVPVPIMYEMRGFNTLMGSHYDHYYIEYEDYSTTVDPEVFELETGMQCGAFPGPGINHLATFNPMREFMHPVDERHVDGEWSRFQNKHSRRYADEKEHHRRRENFRHNLRFVHSINRSNKGFSVAINHLADLDAVELAAMRGRKYSGVYNGGRPFPYHHMSEDDLPASYDWRLYGAVNPVKDQSVCGSCWSFGTTGTLEGAYFLKTGQLVRFSQQALIDCSWGFGNNGCDGGEDFRVYQWMQKHGGIPTEEEYGPYLSNDGYCHANATRLIAPIKAWVNVTVGDEVALKTALLKHGPISIAIDASPRTFTFYSNGVYYDKNCKNGIDELDHAVLAVGYGTIKGKDYWLVKNSWSNYWGNDGYILIAAQDNNCGVMTSPTYVLM